MINIWQQRLTDFETEVKSLNAGFEVWQAWYQDRLQDKPFDVEGLNIVPAEIA